MSDRAAKWRVPAHAWVVELCRVHKQPKQKERHTQRTQTTEKTKQMVVGVITGVGARHSSRDRLRRKVVQGQGGRAPHQVVWWQWQWWL
jgi:hypothetical protein